MIRTFVFDLGNVILDFSHERMCRQMGELLGQSVEKVTAAVIESGLFWQFERGEISSRDFRLTLQEQFDVEVHPRRLARAIADIFTPNESLIPVIRRLKQDGYRLVLLSNTNPMHFSFARRKFEILEVFDAFVLSYEVGYMKPDSPIYERLLEELHCEPLAAFYTDDIHEYVVAARGFGLRAEVFLDTRSFLDYLRQHNISLPPLP